ncbi:MAG: hypothetical protein H2173_00875 [Opitutus sp.]|nr:hypothetical protein [Opitutus sp.]MCS6273921.1 hypothetical protein [Opitutus sp.]MCS6276235.1 hypothetical protein [Opitutus sp.]MCS6301329.1 hypothetical protein [Opitutus sp.]
MSELPALVEVDDFPGEDFVARFRAYLDGIYGIYLSEVAWGGLTFKGQKVRCRFEPETFGKHYAFWHMMQEGRIEDDRTPDSERCKRVRWIAWVIKAAKDGDPRVKVFPEQKRHGNQPWALWLEEANYLVILWERNGSYLLKTAYPVSYAGTLKALKRDWLLHSQGR